MDSSEANTLNDIFMESPLIRESSSCGRKANQLAAIEGEISRGIIFHANFSIVHILWCDAHICHGWRSLNYIRYRVSMPPSLQSNISFEFFWDPSTRTSQQTDKVDAREVSSQVLSVKAEWEYHSDIYSQSFSIQHGTWFNAYLLL